MGLDGSFSKSHPPINPQQHPAAPGTGDGGMQSVADTSKPARTFQSAPWLQDAAGGGRAVTAERLGMEETRRIQGLGRLLFI